MFKARNVKDNISKNYIFTFLINFSLTDGIWMIYLVAVKGLSLYQAGLVEAIFHVTGLLMEIPTGAIADIWGRKASRVLGRVVRVLSIIMFIMADGFLAVALAFVFTALSYNLESGSGQALLYDSLKQIKKEDDFTKIMGRNEVVMHIALIGSLTIGGYIASFNHDYAYIGAGVVAVISAIQALTFIEPKIDEEQQESYSFKSFVNKVKDSVSVIKCNVKLAYYILIFESLGAVVASVKFYLQNYFKGIGYSEAFIGLFLACGAGFAAIIATQAYKLEHFWGERRILRHFPIVMALLIWGVSLTTWPAIFFILLVGLDSLVYVVFSDYINKMIPSNKRATILSMSSMVFSAFMIVIFPIIGALGDTITLGKAFLVIAGITSLIAVSNYFIARKLDSRRV